MSGKTGQLQGHIVTVIAGPTHLSPPEGVRVVSVRSAKDMLKASLREAEGADIFIGTAAVSDWTPVNPLTEKEKKGEDPSETRTILLKRTDDILKSLADKKREGDIRPSLFGFAAETPDPTIPDHLKILALKKLHKKGLDGITANDVSAGQGFGPQENTWHFYTSDKYKQLGPAKKSDLASLLMKDILDMHREKIRDAKAHSKEHLHRDDEVRCL